MQKINFDIKIFDQGNPWEACFHLDEFLANGGVCLPNGEFNWIGAAFTCSAKANDILSSDVNMVQRLSWAYLAISINESMAGSSPECAGQIGRAMMDRVSMIIRFGVQPNDYICDLDRVVNHYLTLPDVQKALEESSSTKKMILDIDTNVRIASEELAALVTAGRLKRGGLVDKLISLIENATAWQK